MSEFLGVDTTEHYIDMVVTFRVQRALVFFFYSKKFNFRAIRCTVTCPLTVVVGLSSHVSQMLTVQTGCSPAATGGMTAHLHTAAFPVHQVTTT